MIHHPSRGYSVDSVGPAFTIGIPVFNRVTMLDEAIRSVVAQSYPMWELHIVDNRSTDDVAGLVKDWEAKDPRIRFHENDTNIGMVANYNRCAHLGSSPFFLLLASDDILHPDFLVHVARAIQANPDAAMICGHRVFWRPPGYTRAYKMAYKGLWPPGSTTMRALSNGNLYGLYSAVVFKRQAFLDSVGAFNEQDPWSADFEACLRMAAIHPVFFETNAFLYQRMGTSTGTSELSANGGIVACERQMLDRLLTSDFALNLLNPKHIYEARLRILGLAILLAGYNLVKGNLAGAVACTKEFRKTKGANGPSLICALVKAIRLLVNRLLLRY